LRYLDRLQPLALLVLRLALGAIMTAHGYHKVFGGLHNFVGWAGSMGIPAWLAYVAVFTEFIGGILILFGFFTRAAAFLTFVDLLVAMWKVDLHGGLFGALGHTEKEASIALAAIAFALIFFGAGPIALDHVLRGGGSTPKRS
jgi:putative oxidoreductase